MPISAVVTTKGASRRAYAIAPFLAAFAAVGLVDVARQLGRLGRLPRALSLALPLLIVGGVGYESVHGYFVDFRNSRDQRWIFAADLTDAVRFMKTLPHGSHIYFFSERWSFSYETRKYIAPYGSGEDRSSEFGLLTRRTTAAPMAPAAFVFLGRYRSEPGSVMQHYSGTVVAGGLPSGTFVA
jgi:hypothetical protein